MSRDAGNGGIEWFEALVFRDGECSARKTAVISEVPLDVYANGEKVATIACTGSHREELAVGYLYSEGIIGKAGDIVGVESPATENAVRVTCADAAGVLPGGPEAAKSIASSGARSGRAKAPPPPFDGGEAHLLNLAPERIILLMEEMIAGAVLHDRTGGTHCAALADSSGIIVRREDIGRHNAVDMLAGHVLMNGIACSDKIIVRTGRASAEIVSKIWHLGIRVVVSISVPTSAAIRLAAQAGMTLVGGVRGGRMIIYNDKGRIAT